MTTLNFRLYDRAGTTLLGLLPEAISYQVGVEFNEVGALTMEYPTAGANAASIVELCEIAIVDGSGVEYQNARYVITNVNRDRVKDAGSITVTAKSIMWRMDTALSWAKRTFTNANAGAVLKPMIDDAVARGALAGITYGFTTTNDTLGAAWTVTTSGDFEARSSILAVMRTLTDQGLAEYAMQGRVLRAAKADTLGTDKTTGSAPLVLYHGRDLEEAPEQRSADGLATALLLEGDDATLVERTNSTGIATYGRLESGVSASGTADTATITGIGDSTLAVTAVPSRQLTVGLSMLAGAPQPLVDFSPGDWVYTSTSAGLERVRVRQVTISMSGGIQSGTATLGDRIYDAEVRLARTLARLTASSKLAGSTTQASTTSDINGVLALIAGATHTFLQTSMPTVDMVEGDLWFDTDDGYRLYRYDGATWVDIQDTDISAALTAALQAQSDAAAASAAAAAKAQTFYQTTSPVSGMNIGDLWFDTDDNNKMYRYGGAGWVSVRDGAIANAQATADGKNLTFYQTTAPTALAAGDLWFDTDDGYKMYRATGPGTGSWVGFALGNSALADISASKLTAGTIDASVINVTNINAGNISTGTLTSIAINNGSGTFSVNAAGAVSCSNLTITGGSISLNGGVFAVSSAGALSATSGTIGGFTISSTQLYTASSALQLISNAGGSGGYNIIAFNGIQAGNFNTSGSIVGGSLSISGNATISGYINGVLYIGSPGTTSSTETWRVSGSNPYGVQRTSSSRRWKNSIVDIDAIPEFDPARLLTLRPRAYKLNDDFLDPSDSRYGLFMPGFIAEEVDDVYPIAVEYDADGLPRSWGESMLLPGMLALIQRQHAAILDLQSRVVALGG